MGVCGYDVIFLLHVHLVMYFHDVWIYALLFVSNRYVAFFSVYTNIHFNLYYILFNPETREVTYFLCIQSIVGTLYSL